MAAINWIVVFMVLFFLKTTVNGLRTTESFAYAQQTTSLQDHKSTSGYRLDSANASQTTSPQDYETTSGYRTTSCLVD